MGRSIPKDHAPGLQLPLSGVKPGLQHPVFSPSAGQARGVQIDGDTLQQGFQYPLVTKVEQLPRGETADDNGIKGRL